MKKSILVVMLITLGVLFGGKAFSQKDFEVQNASGYKLYGLMVCPDGETEYSDDLLTESEFPSGTTATVTLPVGFNCQTIFKVSYKVGETIYYEVIAVADVCNHSGFIIQKNPEGTSGHWMTTQYID